MTTLPQSTSIQLPRPVGPAPLAHAPAQGAMHHASQSGQMTGSDVIRVIRTNIWLIIGSVVLAVLVGFGLNTYLAKYHSRYTAMGYIQVQRGKTAQLLSRDDAPLDDTQALTVEQRTQAQILTTEALFTKVLQDPNADTRKTEWFKQFSFPDGRVDIAAAKESLSRQFSAAPIADSKLIMVTMSGQVPEDCRTIMLDIVNKHLEDQHKLSSTSLVERVSALKALSSRWENQMKDLRLKSSKEASTLQLDGFGGARGSNQKEQELQILVSKKLDGEAKLIATRQQAEQANAEVQQGITPGYVDAMVNQTPMIARLRATVDDLDIQIRSMQNQGGSSKSIQPYIAQKEATEHKLDELTAEETAKQTSSYLSALQGAVASAQGEVDQLNKQMDKIKADLADMAARLSDYMTWKDEEASLQEMWRRTRDQLDRLNVIMTQADMNNVGWISRPERPDAPSFPKLTMTLSLCVAVALGLSLGISFLREIFDTSVRSPRDIARVGQMTLLGMIPHEDDDPQAEGVPLASVIYGAPTSMLAEQFRQVRTRLQHAASLDTTRSILITSPSPGDGKSIVACNLAAGLALNGRRILLVDANFRRPELHKTFGMGNEIGFGTVLTSIDNFGSCIRQTRVPNLDLMTAGPKPANATELLESQLLIDFIERALEEYDHVIFDSGPMLVVSETVALAPRVDGVITVVRASANSRGLLTRMKDTLKQLKAEHLGVILNGVRSTGGGYYGRNIKTYYEYQNGNNAAA